MGERGPAPQPTAIRLLRGDHPERVNRAEPAPAPAAEEIRPPAWLGIAARNTWRQYAPDLIRQGVLTAWDIEAFAHWCDAVARRRRAVRLVAKEGEIVEEPILLRGQPTGFVRKKRHPALFILAEADAEALKWGARFGLTPSDRSQIKVGEGRAEDSEADRLLSG